MRLVKKPSIDWEPLVCRAGFFENDVPDTSAFEQRCVDWLSQREPRTTVSCACNLAFFRIFDVRSGSIYFLCEWLCSQCLPVFGKYLEETFASIEFLEVGQHETVLSSVLATDFIAVPATSVEFEDGRNARAGAFLIGRRKIRVKDFRGFVEATGYRTTAEQQGAPYTFLANTATAGLSSGELDESPVTYISFLDASAYCVWAGYRLPSEAEWVAAAVADPEIYSPGQFKQRQFPLKVGRFLRDLSVEWTGTIDRSGNVVVRRGPRWARTTRWKEEVNRHRFIVPVDGYDIMTGFRVVALREVNEGPAEKGGVRV